MLNLVQLENAMKKKAYLGDSVYIAPTENGYVITTENGLGPSNEIFLEPQVVKALVNYLKEEE